MPSLQCRVQTTLGRSLRREWHHQAVKDAWLIHNYNCKAALLLLDHLGWQCQMKLAAKVPFCLQSWSPRFKSRDLQLRALIAPLESFPHMGLPNRWADTLLHKSNKQGNDWKQRCEPVLFLPVSEWNTPFCAFQTSATGWFIFQEAPCLYSMWDTVFEKWPVCSSLLPVWHL